jgi:hypothetical protein
VTDWMIRFQVEFRRQLLQLVGHWSYWAIHLAFGVLLKMLFWYASDETPEYILSSSPGTISTGLIILIAMLLSGLAASRAGAARFTEMLESYPVGSELTAAGWLASTLAAMGFVLEPMLLAGLGRSFISLLNGLNPFFWFVLAGVSLGSAFTWWLASLVQFRRWVFPVLVAVWVAFWVGPMFLNRYGVSLAIIDLPTRMQNADFDDSFGRLEPAGLSGWMCLALIALAVLILSLALNRIQRVRFHHPNPFILVFTGLTVLAMLTGTMNFYITLRDLRQRASISLDGQNTVAGLGDTTARRYDVELDLISSDNPQVQAAVQIENTGETSIQQLDLALFHGFEITAANLPYQRNGNRVTFSLPSSLQPGSVIDLTLSYQGELATYMEGPQIPVVLEFLQAGRGKVGLDSQWLPVVGDAAMDSLTGGNRLASPAAFSLKVKSRPGVSIFCNLSEESTGVYSTTATDWVYLQYSTRMAVQAVDGAVLVAPADLIEAMRPGADGLSKVYGTLRTYFPDVPEQELSILVQEYAYGLPSLKARVTDNHDLLVEPSFLLATLDSDYALLDSQITGLIVDDFYAQTGHETVPLPASMAIARFVWAYHLCNSDISKIGNYMGDPNPLETELTAIAAQFGEDGIRAAISTLANTPPELAEPEEIAQWLRKSNAQN